MTNRLKKANCTVTNNVTYKADGCRCGIGKCKSADFMCATTPLAYQKRRRTHFTTTPNHIIMWFMFEEARDDDQGMVRAMTELPETSLPCRASCTTTTPFSPLESIDYV